MESRKIVGIDVSSTNLDCYDLEGKRYSAFKNDKEGIKKLVLMIQKIEAKLIVLEATGHYHKMVTKELMAQGINVSVVNPRLTKHFAKASGLLAKTDKIDAKMLAEYGEKMSPPVRQLARQEVEDLRLFVDRRNQLIGMISSEKNRCKSTLSDEIKEDIERTIRLLQESVDSFEKKILNSINKDERFKRLNEIITSVPSVGSVASSTLLSYLPELGTISREAIASIVGVAPFNRDSGKHSGKRYCFGGREDVRKVLYMNVISAIKHNEYINRYYMNLKANNKPGKVALVACARKLIILLNTLVAKDRCWSPNFTNNKI
jgi:transposase